MNNDGLSVNRAPEGDGGDVSWRRISRDWRNRAFYLIKTNQRRCAYDKWGFPVRFFLHSLPQTFGRRSIHVLHTFSPRRPRRASHTTWRGFAPAEKSIFPVSSAATELVLKRAGSLAVWATLWATMAGTRFMRTNGGAGGRYDGIDVYIRVRIRFSAHDLRGTARLLRPYITAVSVRRDKCRKSYRSPVTNRLVPGVPRAHTAGRACTRGANGTSAGHAIIFGLNRKIK